jgi:diguanylate cyclase (GGDEF)-like protein
VVGGVLGAPIELALLGLAVAFFIPLLIAPPIAYIALSIIRLLHETIARVDDHMRHDGLTGALNRSHFLDRVRAFPSASTLMIIDVDHFKRINDSFGHAAGDEVLRMLAHAVQEVVGTRGLVGRLGGEEFAVFLPQANADIALLEAEAIRLAVSALGMVVEGRRLAITISIGCAMHHPSSPIGTTLKQADALLYEAKQSGRNRVMPPVPQRQPQREQARA